MVVKDRPVLSLLPLANNFGVTLYPNAIGFLLLQRPARYTRRKPVFAQVGIIVSSIPALSLKASHPVSDRVFLERASENTIQIVSDSLSSFLPVEIVHAHDPAVSTYHDRSGVGNRASY